MQEVRTSRDNKFASTNDKSMRWAISMPEKLHLALDRVFPGYLNSPVKINRFMREFGEFRVPEKV